MPKETVRLLLLLFLHLLLCTFSTGLNGSNEERQTLYILAMVPFPDPEKPAWAKPNYGAAHSLLPAAQLAVDQINNRSDVLQDYNLELLEGDSGCNVVTTTYVSQVEQILYSGKKSGRDRWASLFGSSFVSCCSSEETNRRPESGTCNDRQHSAIG